MRKLATIVFSVIWLIGAGVFASLARDAYGSMSIELARVQEVETPPYMHGEILGVDMGKFFADITEANNRNVATLEGSIRGSARLSFTLNMISCFAALAGFVAQIFSYRNE